jgi:hypothetical protein
MDSFRFILCVSAAVAAGAPAAAGWEIGVIPPPDPWNYRTLFTSPPCDFTDTCIKYFPGQDPTVVYTYWNAADSTLYQANLANPELRKIVWFHLVLDTDFGMIGRPDPLLSTDFGAEVTLIGATYLPWDGAKTELFASWLIRPQPRSETVQLAGLFIPADHITEMEIRTICVPEPGTWAMLICGFALVGAMSRRRVEGTAREAVDVLS